MNRYYNIRNNVTKAIGVIIFNGHFRGDTHDKNGVYYEMKQLVESQYNPYFIFVNNGDPAITQNKSDVNGSNMSIKHGYTVSLHKEPQNHDIM